MFHLDVAYVCNGFQMFFRCFHKCFKHLFQVFYLSSFVLPLSHFNSHFSFQPGAAKILWTWRTLRDSECRHFTAVLERLLKRDRGSLLQLLYLDVSKVDRVFHMGCAWDAADGTDDVWGGMGDV